MSNSTVPRLFSFEEVENKYKTFQSKCQVDTDCPDNLKCTDNNLCQLLFECKENDLKRCAVNNGSGIYFTSCTSNEDCLSSSCVNNQCTGRLIMAAVGNGEAIYGLDTGENCSNDEECFERYCKDGICSRYDLRKPMNKLLYGIIGSTVVTITLYP
ncbi:hypothetical protein PIROE2DRAFT_1956 [Piromyces sp. E2]|nr:hypothetical protein PIROE2DRAFT_1956 [Piromyces sp. E2]|eukprot:OUM70011.1 hypothetical protein PIROE2DRAFT_1956 [Piromyces sp. E2]